MQMVLHVLQTGFLVTDSSKMFETFRIKLTWNNSISIFPKKALECGFEASSKVLIETTIQNWVDGTVKIRYIHSSVLYL